MKISEVMAQLQKELDYHGDIEVMVEVRRNTCHAYDCQCYAYPPDVDFESPTISIEPVNKKPAVVFSEY